MKFIGPSLQENSCSLELPLGQWASKLTEACEDLISSMCCSSRGEYLVIYQRALHDHPPAGLMSRARILVSKYGEYELQVLLQTIKKGTIDSEETLEDLASIISKSSPYKFCPGLSLSSYEAQYSSVLRYDSKGVKLIREPYIRVQSNTCQLWHKLAKNASIFEKSENEVLCQPCKKMRSHLDQRVREAQKATPAVRSARLDVSSRCPMSTLSPNSQKKRKGKMVKEQYQLKHHFDRMELSLDDDQSDEMANIVTVLNDSTHRASLDEVIDGAGCQNKGDIMRELWRNDTRAAQDQFRKDQATNG